MAQGPGSPSFFRAQALRGFAARVARIPPQLEKNHVVPTSWQDEALARLGVSREVPCSALKGDDSWLHSPPRQLFLTVCEMANYLIICVPLPRLKLHVVMLVSLIAKLRFVGDETCPQSLKRVGLSLDPNLHSSSAPHLQLLL